MKILLIEDDENKRLQIKRFLEESYPNMVIDVARSFQSGLDALCDGNPDIVLLDMTIPNYDAGPDETGGYMYKTGGWELLRQMDRFEIVKPVIVVTQFEKFGDAPDAMDLQDLNRKLQAEHSDVYRGYVYYNAAISGWRSELRKQIDQVIGAEGRA